MCSGLPGLVLSLPLSPSKVIAHTAKQTVYIYIHHSTLSQGNHFCILQFNISQIISNKFLCTKVCVCVCVCTWVFAYHLEHPNSTEAHYVHTSLTKTFTLVDMHKIFEHYNYYYFNDWNIMCENKTNIQFVTILTSVFHPVVWNLHVKINGSKFWRIPL